jgi:hypothetical protein
MSDRNVWLKFDEWELINKELSDQEYHSFKLSQCQVDEWKKSISRYSFYENRKFSRVGVYPEIKNVKSPRAFNILCREHWRDQDMYYVMKSTRDLVGFIINHVDDVDMDTSFEKWEEIRNEMNTRITDSDQRMWWDSDLIKLYNEVVA